MLQELHILIGCADARDLNQLQVDAVASKTKEFAEKGIHIDLHVIRAAGSFVTHDIFEDIRRIIYENQKSTSLQFDKTDYFVHIQTHGHLTDDSLKDYVSHIYQMNIVDGSPLNCGMLGATGVGVEIEKMIIEERLTVEYPKGKIVIDEDDKIRLLLKEVYAHNGYLAGDWIKSIDYLRTHPRSQKAKLEDFIDRDPGLKRLGIKITAGIQDYSIHSLIRLDGGIPQVPFWDELQLDIRKKAPQMLELLNRQSEIQRPYAGLLSMSDPKTTSRLLAAEYYLSLRNIDCGGNYRPNTIFNITGSSFDVPHTPFGPYVIAGFFYAVKHLKLNDQMVMGYDQEQTHRMLKKIENDPLMNLIVHKFEVNLIPINQLELSAKI